MSEGPLKQLYIEGIIEFDKPNLNGQKYSRECIESAIEKSDIIYGGLGYPEGPQLSVATDMTKVSHVVTNLITKNTSLNGDVEVLDTPHGRMLMKCINDGLKFAPRGLGNIDSEGNVTDLQLLSIDVIRDINT